MRKLIPLLASVVTIGALTASSSAQSNGHDPIAQARGAYYNLKKHGFQGFKAAIEPNWEVTLGSTATEENLKVFRALRFSMTVDANGAVTVMHGVADADRARVEPYARQIHDNVQRLVTGFFSMWSRFMINSPFPENQTQTKMENSGKEYRLSFTAESADVTLTMTNDLLITEWKLTGPRAKRIVTPLFEKTPEGLLLNGYQSHFEPVAEGFKTTLDYTIQYQDVAGLKLPHKIEIRGMHGTEPVAAELKFTQYVLTPRQAN